MTDHFENLQASEVATGADLDAIGALYGRKRPTSFPDDRYRRLIGLAILDVTRKAEIAALKSRAESAEGLVEEFRRLLDVDAKRSTPRMALLGLIGDLRKAREEIERLRIERDTATKPLDARVEALTAEIDALRAVLPPPIGAARFTTTRGHIVTVAPDGEVSVRHGAGLGNLWSTNANSARDSSVILGAVSDPLDIEIEAHRSGREDALCGAADATPFLQDVIDCAAGEPLTVEQVKAMVEGLTVEQVKAMVEERLRGIAASGFISDAPLSRTVGALVSKVNDDGSVEVTLATGGGFTVKPGEKAAQLAAMLGQRGEVTVTVDPNAPPLDEIVPLGRMAEVGADPNKRFASDPSAPWAIVSAFAVDALGAGRLVGQVAGEPFNPQAFAEARGITHASRPGFTRFFDPVDERDRALLSAFAPVGYRFEFCETMAKGFADRNGDPNWPLPSFDAADWAGAFMATWGERRAEIDEALMLGWFANALMRGFDERGWREAKAAQADALPPSDAFTAWAVDQLERQARPVNPRSDALARALSAQKPLDGYAR